MTRLLAAARVAVVAVMGAAALGPACNCVGDGTCTSNDQCDTEGKGYQACDTKRGVCICKDDRGCGKGEFCNALGSCQAIAGCATNDDCGTELFCDTTSSHCLSLTECGGDACCTLDDQCAFGFVCEQVTKSCVEGCRDEADCVLGLGCAGGGLGQLGTCGTTCTSDVLCPPGYLCNLDVGKCEKDDRGPYCLACSGGVVSDDCGTPGNYCLVDTTIASNPPTEFCGVDCFYQQSCPSGYDCQQVIIVPPSAPLCGAESCQGNTCSSSGGACSQSEDCPLGPPQGDCVASRGGRAGNCDTSPFAECTSDNDCSGTCILTECRGGEGAALGSCSCTARTDCPTDACEGGDIGTQTEGHCQLSGHRCFENADCDVITCFEGGCLIGSNCAPSNDRSCGDFVDNGQ